jgi:hypothetical protein
VSSSSSSSPLVLSLHLKTPPEHLTNAAIVLYFTRHYWTPYLPSRLQDLSLPGFAYTPLPTSFRNDVESGLHSANFDLTSNITTSDGRSGLDATAKAEVMRIMKRRGVGFDEARRIFMEASFKKNGIGSDGLPKDPKFVSFS